MTFLKQLKSRANPRRRARRPADAGFSLLEVMITLVIIGLIVTLVGPRLMSTLDRSKTTTARIQAKSLRSALDTMRLDIGRYPTPEEGLTSLRQAPADSANWQGPYLETDVPKDPWGRPYVYQPAANPDDPPRIGSLGGDGKPGGEGSAQDTFSDDPT